MFNLVPFNHRNRDLFRTDDFFEEFFNNFTSFDLGNKDISRFKTDIKENEKEYIVQAELPGVSKDNINIELNENYMTITASNTEIIEEEKDKYIRKERRSGRFQRSFNINNINTEEIQAKYENGILEIKLPKANKSNKLKKINIQ